MRLCVTVQEVIEWLANPENLNAEKLPPFIENFDAVPYLLSGLPIAGTVLGINLLQEIAHRSVASLKKVWVRNGFFACECAFWEMALRGMVL